MKNSLLHLQSVVFRNWICAPTDVLTPIYTNSDEPTLIIRDSNEACQTDAFRMSKCLASRTLRLSSNVSFTFYIEKIKTDLFFVEWLESSSQMFPWETFCNRN